MLKTLQNFVKIGKNFKIPLYLELRSFKTPLYLVLSGPQKTINMVKKNPGGKPTGCSPLALTSLFLSLNSGGYPPQVRWGGW